MKKFEKAATYDSQPTRMDTRPGKGPGASRFSLTQNAKYGVDGGGHPPTKMSRSVGRGKSGNGWALGPEGPRRSSRKDTGGNTAHCGLKYGVGGCGHGGGSGYGVGGI